MIVSLSGNIDDDARDMKSALRLLDQIHQETTNRKWQVRCGDARYLGPWIASVLLSGVLVGKQRGQNPRVKLPQSPAKLVAYCVFSGMEYEFAGGQRPNPEHPNSETVPLSAFSQASWGLSEGIVRLIRRHTLLSNESEDGLRTCIQEVTQNVVDHSRSPIGGVMSARYFSEPNEVRVGIVDRGIGIGAALRTRYPDTASSYLALSRVIGGGYSSYSRPNNMGLGVSNLFSLVRHAHGRIAVFSGDAVAESHAASPPTIESLDFAFPGTAVFFSIPLVGDPDRTDE